MATCTAVAGRACRRRKARRYLSAGWIGLRAPLFPSWLQAAQKGRSEHQTGSPIIAPAFDNHLRPPHFVAECHLGEGSRHVAPTTTHTPETTKFRSAACAIQLQQYRVPICTLLPSPSRNFSIQAAYYGCSREAGAAEAEGLVHWVVLVSSFT